MTAEAPSLLEFSWGPDPLRFEIAPASDGCTLTLTDTTTNLSQTIAVQTLSAGTGLTSETLNFSSLGVSMTLSGCGASSTAANMVHDLTALTLMTATAGGSVTFQIGANANQTMSVSVKDSQSSALGVTGIAGYTTLKQSIASFTAAVAGGTGAAAAQFLMASVDQAVTDVSSNRSTLGAAQNRLEHTVSNLGVAQENLLASESRIRDVDMAAEMVNFTKTGILQQAGQAILAQANQAPAGVMSLLR